MVATVVLIAVLLLVAIPIIASWGRTKGRRGYLSQLRGIHQGLVFYGQSNKFYYPGLDSLGQPVPDGPETTGNSGDGTTVEARYWIMLRGDFFTPKYAISPSETQAIAEYDGSVNKVISADGDFPGPVTAANYSFAMLDIDQPGERVGEWKETANAQAVVMSDRNTGTAAAPASIQSESKAGWQGLVLWNDNHIFFEKQPYFETKYHNSGVFSNDYLFGADSGDDAYLIYSGR